MNLLDLDSIHEATDRPTIAVSFEDSEGLNEAIEAAFSGAERERRLDAYEALPPRRRLSTEAGEFFVRNVGIDDERTKRVVRAYTHDRRPEPLWVANRLARRVDSFRRG